MGKSWGMATMGVVAAGCVAVLFIYYKISFEMNWGISVLGAAAMAACTSIVVVMSIFLDDAYMRSHRVHKLHGKVVQNTRLTTLVIFVIASIFNVILSKIVYYLFSKQANFSFCNDNCLFFYFRNHEYNTAMFVVLTTIPIVVYLFFSRFSIYHGPAGEN